MMRDHQQAPRHARRLRKAWWLVPLALAVLVVIAWLWALPWYIEKRLVETYSSMTGRDVTIEDVALDPLNAGVTLRGVSLAGEEQTPVFSSERIEAEIEWSSLWSPGWQLDSLAIQTPRLQLIWLSGGELNLVQLLGGEGGDGQASTPIRIRQIQVSEGRLDWIDRRMGEPITLTFEQVQLDARGYDSTTEEPFTLQGQADWNGGSLSGEGDMGFSPWRVDAELSAEQVPLGTLSDYLALVIRARVNEGSLAAQLRVQAGAASDTGTRVTGSAELSEPEMLAPDVDEPMASANQMVIEGLVFESGQPQLQAEQVSLREPWIDVVIDEQLETNLTAWRPPEQEDDVSQEGDATDDSSMQYSLATLAIEDGAVAFADRHLPQPFRIDFSALQGEWNNISSAQEGGGQLALRGEVSDGSPMRVEGAFDPLGDAMQGNLNLHFESLALTTFAPYVREFSGYEVEQGQVTLDLDYRLEDGQMQTHNHVLLRRLELGEQVDDSVTELPIRALVGALQGDDGVIELEIPMSFPLDDPSSVDFGGIAGQAIREVLENLLNSPIETLSETLDAREDGNEGAQNDARQDDSEQNEDQDEGGAAIYERARTPM
ncbi:DUF748 domain-containing protein [Halomonas sp. TRM85114]|uniref:DUF748 domain-containing protein n=1 Tax=Halomonas jincaotanensis TaxID=2810616 RepID=UPI001BD23ED1|nr:DUF748 domain-containing protein [Halomonas jincaotanensis]MBS9402848.1 DUF748 domain-containing protein [Halomonas jincaotanensis]